MNKKYIIIDWKDNFEQKNHSKVFFSLFTMPSRYVIILKKYKKWHKSLLKYLINAFMLTGKEDESSKKSPFFPLI